MKRLIKRATMWLFLRQWISFASAQRVFSLIDIKHS
jgi:hypothetical protein